MNTLVSKQTKFQTYNIDQIKNQKLRKQNNRQKIDIVLQKGFQQTNFVTDGAYKAEWTGSQLSANVTVQQGYVSPKLPTSKSWQEITNQDDKSSNKQPVKILDNDKETSVKIYDN